MFRNFLINFCHAVNWSTGNLLLHSHRSACVTIFQFYFPFGICRHLELFFRNFFFMFFLHQIYISHFAFLVFFFYFFSVQLTNNIFFLFLIYSNQATILRLIIRQHSRNNSFLHFAISRLPWIASRGRLKSRKHSKT